MYLDFSAFVTQSIFCTPFDCWQNTITVFCKQFKAKVTHKGIPTTYEYEILMVLGNSVKEVVD